MRTTLDIDSTVLEAARALASERRISLGAAVSELARKGLRGSSPDVRDGIPAFRVRGGSSPITADMVREANEEQ